MARVVGATHWRRVLELLLNVLDDRGALLADEATDEQLGLGVRRSRHGTRDSREATQTSRAQLSDLGHLRQVEDGNLIQRLLLVVDAALHHGCSAGLAVHEFT